MRFVTLIAYLSLIICLAGILYRLVRWCVLPLGPESEDVGIIPRLLAAITALAATLVLPRRLVALMRTVLLEVIVQRRILRQSRVRWAVHMMIFYGMLLLIVMHTFDDQITAHWFSGYASTLNPFMFLRNLLGIMVLAGVIVALWRRRSVRTPRRITAFSDLFLPALLAGIVLTGAALEAVQIISPTLFDQMVSDYMRSEDPEEIAPLKAFWSERFEVAFTPPPTHDPVVMRQGRRLHAEYCAACHSRPVSAVLAFPLVLAIKPLSEHIGGLDLTTWLWYVHYLISCLALALLPFSKLFHLFAAPVSLIARALGPAATDSPANRPTRRAMSLDACTHCGVCNRHCAVAPIFQVIANPRILPSEKLGGVADLAAGRKDACAHILLAEGSCICTACGRCTRFCPSGIDLQDLWAASTADLNRQGYAEPHGRIGRHTASEWAQILKTHPHSNPGKSSLQRPDIRLADNPDTFWACIQCSTCTNVCPVVAASEDPQRDLELTPQQIMNLMRLQLKETALGSRMVWNCVTCYKCQEHCPQNVRVADVLYELRNEAFRRLMPMQTPDRRG